MYIRLNSIFQRGKVMICNHDWELISAYPQVTITFITHRCSKCNNEKSEWLRGIYTRPQLNKMSAEEISSIERH